MQDIQDFSLRSKQKFGLLRITMEDLKVLKRRKKEIIKKIEKLRKDLDNVEDRITEIEGIDKDVEDIREVSENVTKDKKKRPRPSYKENSNLELEERTQKRQKRIDKIVSPETMEDSELEDEQQETIQGLEMDEDNLGFDFNEEESIKQNRKRQSKKEIEDLLEEISEKELKDLEFDKGINVEGITEEISKLYFKLCKQEGILFEGKRGMMEIYFEFGRIFEEKINNLIDNEQNEEISAVTKIIDEIMKGGVNHNRRTILRKSEKARKIYKIISADGGKEKIKKLKYLNSEDYMKFNFKEIEEWIKNY
jgi:hypothetical protein